MILNEVFFIGYVFYSLMTIKTYRTGFLPLDNFVFLTSLYNSIPLKHSDPMSETPWRTYIGPLGVSSGRGGADSAGRIAPLLSFSHLQKRLLPLPTSQATLSLSFSFQLWQPFSSHHENPTTRCWIGKGKLWVMKGETIFHVNSVMKMKGERIKRNSSLFSSALLDGANLDNATKICTTPPGIPSI